MDGEFHEADILWPDTPRDEPLLPFAPSEPRRLEEESPFFLPGVQSSSSGAIPDTDDDDDDDEWQEADVLWPDTVVDDGSRLGTGGSPWSCRGGYERRVNPAAPWCQGWTPGVSSPIDIPANVAAGRRRVCAAVGGWAVGCF